MGACSDYGVIGKEAVARCRLPELLGPTRSFSTANGAASASTASSVDIPALSEIAVPHVLPNSPAVLSIGRRCMEHGVSFHWSAGQAPFMIRPDGVEAHLQVRGCIPYLYLDTAATSS